MIYVVPKLMDFRSLDDDSRSQCQTALPSPKRQQLKTFLKRQHLARATSAFRERQFRGFLPGPDAHFRSVPNVALTRSILSFHASYTTQHTCYVRGLSCNIYTRTGMSTGI